MILNPLHFASTPIALMRDIGLKTYAGLSADDPENSRHFNTTFAVVLSVFGNDVLIGRAIIDNLLPHEHKFYCLDDELEKLGWDKETRLCVVHRIPEQFVEKGNILAQVDLPEKPDFEMYRTVVQYGLPEGGFGGVIYETPPNFNKTGRPSDFLTFSNKIYVGDDAETYLLLINYSISNDYSSHASVKLNIYSGEGTQIGSTEINVPPFNFSCIDAKTLIPSGQSGNFYNFIGSAHGVSLIPLSVNVSPRNGGVSVEHSHPPHAYLMTDWVRANSIKSKAAVYNTEH